jgi:soluble lytic murein transglycosylase-like protein
METIFVASAFVWFLFLTPSSSPPVTPYKPPVHNEKNIRASSGTKKKLERYIKQQNPNIGKTDSAEIAHWIDEYSAEEDVDPMLVAALIGRESSFKKRAVSSTGAKGLGQLKDFNHKPLGIKDPYNVRQNVRGTVKYLKNMMGEWKGNKDSTRLALASYYQGPNKTKKVKKKRGKMAGHVNKYVDDIMTKYKKLSNR